MLDIDYSCSLIRYQSVCTVSLETVRADTNCTVHTELEISLAHHIAFGINLDWTKKKTIFVYRECNESHPGMSL